LTPANLRFGGGAAESAILPQVAFCLLIAVVLILALPRHKALTPFLAACFIIPLGQVVVLGGIHLTPLRILILPVLARRASFRKSEKYPGGFNGMDRMAILWSVSAVVMFWVQFPEAIVTGLGVLVDTFGGYLAVRFLIPDGQAMRKAIRVIAVVCVIQGIPMVIEQIAHINVFGLVAGVPLAPAVREGHIRASGTMGCLTAGPFAGALIPVFLWLRTERGSRMIAYVGLAAATAMVVASYSSTSWMALAGSLIGLAFWPLRKRMRMVRRGLFCTIVGLHMVMKAPVWALIARIDLTGSSSGYQRFTLVDMTIRHFSTWWLIGTPDYVNWGWDSYDLCNQFVAVALTGGLLPLIAYIAILSRSFGAIGTARKAVAGMRGQEWFYWCMGSELFSMVMTHWGINYVGVLLMDLFVFVACVSVATSEARESEARRLERPAEAQPVPAAGAAESLSYLTA